MKAEVANRKADYVGITGSILCIIHCLVTPVLLMTSSLVADSALRIGYLSLDYVFIGVNIVAVYFATRHFTLPLIRTGLWFFLASFSMSMLLEDVSPTFEYLGYASSLGLVAMHLLNIRYHRLYHQH
jgi:hypothetical protein